ncbi:TetR/AcrR family transcriptional regulator [Mycolicibacterium litorale]|uniref:TetR/AcrR family transcriptional regulator n=1 Tax=Mycolicibacterium litorale TaxID=758802 RepID=UPI003CEC28FB
MSSTDSTDETWGPLPGRPTGRSQADRAREAILEATLDLLTKRGYAATSVDRIAASAGVSKATIYRHWRTKAEIVVELLGRFADDASTPVDTGDIRSDLLLALKRLIVLARRLRGAGHSVIAAAFDEPILEDAMARLIAQWRTRERQIVRRYVERGLVPRDIDEDIATDFVISTVHFRVFFAASPEQPDPLAERLVDPILRAWKVRGYVGE